MAGQNTATNYVRGVRVPHPVRIGSKLRSIKHINLPLKDYLEWCRKQEGRNKAE